MTVGYNQRLRARIGWSVNVEVVRLRQRGENGVNLEWRR